MGINLTGKVVSYDGSHQKLINSDPELNPTISIIRNLTVHSAFQRVKARSLSGDGNPLMYALKGINGYSISRKDVVKFVPDFEGVILKLQVEFAGATFVPMPSASPIAEILARRSCAAIPGTQILNNLFEKKTCADVHKELVLISPPVNHKQEFKQLLRNLKHDPNSNISLKKVDLKLRGLINPLKLRIVPVINTPIILVDDLLATGTTLLGARDLLLGLNFGQPMHGFCLFGKL